MLRGTRAHAVSDALGHLANGAQRQQVGGTLLAQVAQGDDQLPKVRALQRDHLRAATSLGAGEDAVPRLGRPNRPGLATHHRLGQRRVGRGRRKPPLGRFRRERIRRRVAGRVGRRLIKPGRGSIHDPARRLRLAAVLAHSAACWQPPPSPRGHVRGHVRGHGSSPTMPCVVLAGCGALATLCHRRLER